MYFSWRFLRVPQLHQHLQSSLRITFMYPKSTATIKLLSMMIHKMYPTFAFGKKFFTMCPSPPMEKCIRMVSFMNEKLSEALEKSQNGTY